MSFELHGNFYQAVRAVCLVMLIFMFVNYQLIRDGDTNSKAVGRDDQLTDAAYFTSTTLSTCGYGDIMPVTPYGKKIVAAEQIFIIFLAFGLLALKDANGK
jgi:hypothetical protein